eukprot:scaffold17852_cov20-Tisochrysis_lutea.AAC.2
MAAVEGDADKAAFVVSPVVSGRKCLLPVEARERLYMWASALRAMGVRVSRPLVMGTVNMLIKDTEVAELFKHKAVRADWYARFKTQVEISEGKVRRIELDRKRWCTSANVELWYKRLGEWARRSWSWAWDGGLVRTRHPKKTAHIS